MERTYRIACNTSTGRVEPFEHSIIMMTNYLIRLILDFFAVVLQAFCDADRRFTFASVKCPGSTHDSVAWAMTKLADVLASGALRGEYWIAADDAYPVSDYILTPFPGRNVSGARDTFNYMVSRLRCNIECAFGMLYWR